MKKNGTATRAAILVNIKSAVMFTVVNGDVWTVITRNAAIILNLSMPATIDLLFTAHTPQRHNNAVHVVSGKLIRRMVRHGYFDQAICMQRDKADLTAKAVAVKRKSVAQIVMLPDNIRIFLQR